MKPN
jgi:hypothetical protein